MTIQVPSRKTFLRKHLVVLSALVVGVVPPTACIARTKGVDIRLGVADRGNSSAPSRPGTTPTEAIHDLAKVGVQATEGDNQAEKWSQGIIVTGKKDNSEIVVTGRRRRPPVAFNKQLFVVANLLPPKSGARRDFDPVVRLGKVRRDAKRIEALAFVLGGVDGIVSGSCIASGRCIELNPIFGKTPSMGKLLGAKTMVGGLVVKDGSQSADMDPYAARSESYVHLTTNLIAAISSMGTGL